MDIITWKQDSIKELYDVCGSPNWVQHCINNIIHTNVQPNGALDCDDFSIWASNVIMEYYNPKILCVAYYDGQNNVSGHAVCLCNEKDMFLPCWQLGFIKKI